MLIIVKAQMVIINDVNDKRKPPYNMQ
jgi:hypothetical protein